jgi:hypothetical protein
VLVTRTTPESPDVHDFYAGFEGEPELRFVRGYASEPRETIRLWSGYFDELMRHACPVDGAWRGLALPYHLDEGWYSESPWPIPDVAEAARQWNEMDVGAATPDARRVHAAIGALLATAMREAEPVVVWRD